MILEQGDLIKRAENGNFDVIIHGCNCFHTMGAGIAKSIRDKYPQAYIADKRTKIADREKLGSYSSVDVVSPGGHKFTIVNAYTQFNYGRNKDNFSYETFPLLLSRIKEEFGDKRIGMPLIGCSLAGGNEPVILKMIKDGFDGVDYTLVDLDPNRKLKLIDLRYDSKEELSPLNNNYLAKFNHKGIDFISVNQFIAYSKARMFKDDYSASKILDIGNLDYVKDLLSRDSNEIMQDFKLKRSYDNLKKSIKNLEIGIKNFNLDNWNEKELAINFVGMREKIAQNDGFIDFAVNAKNNTFSDSPQEQSANRVKDYFQKKTIEPKSDTKKTLKIKPH